MDGVQVHLISSVDKGEVGGDKDKKKNWDLYELN